MPSLYDLAALQLPCWWVATLTSYGKKGDVPVHARLTKHVFNLRDVISTQTFLK